MKKLFVLIISLSFLFLSACSFQEEESLDEVEEADYINHSVFNGMDIGENQNIHQAFGIMIENSRVSRPQSAIGLADIVYETAVETYTITRFMAIFASQHPTKIGPVRSARIPFVRMIQEWGLPYAHYGSAAMGQGDAKSIIESIDIPIRFDGHQGINDEFYLRDKSRRPPHNAYFDGEAAVAKIPEIKYKKHFEFDETTNVNQEDISRVNLRYSSENQVGYVYDPENKNYLRYINNQPMMDEYINDQIRVTNIITLHAPHTSAESVQYVLVDFLGEGKAEYFVNGKYEEGTWRKFSYDERTKYYDSDGNPIQLLPGNTWIQVVHDNVEIIKE